MKTTLLLISRMRMLGAISSQMMVGHQDLQQQNLRLSHALQKVIADTDKFKKEIRDELTLLQSQGSLSNTSSSPMISVPATAVVQGPASSSGMTSNMTCVPLSSGSPSVTTETSTDFQTQMLNLLNQTFTQLTMVIHETKTIIGETKGSDSKSDWTKFSGDTQKFRSWYLGIMSQISISPWKDLYDSTSNNVVQTTSNTALNGKLYAKVISSLEGQAFQHMVARPHIRGNGILLLQELHQMYKP